MQRLAVHMCHLLTKVELRTANLGALQHKVFSGDAAHPGAGCCLEHCPLKPACEVTSRRVSNGLSFTLNVHDTPFYAHSGKHPREVAGGSD